MNELTENCEVLKDGASLLCGGNYNDKMSIPVGSIISFSHTHRGFGDSIPTDYFEYTDSKTKKFCRGPFAPGFWGRPQKGYLDCNI